MFPHVKHCCVQHSREDPHQVRASPFSSHTNSPLLRTKKEVTYCDHIDFPLTSWSDLSDWPQLETIARQGADIIGVNLERKVEPGDNQTREAFESLKNKFVQQNCHRDVEIRYLNVGTPSSANP